MKGRRSIRQNPSWDWDGIFDSIISRYLRERTEWANNEGEGWGVEITSWNDGSQTKSKFRPWRGETTACPSPWVWGQDTSSACAVPASPKRRGGQRKSLNWNMCLGGSQKPRWFWRKWCGIWWDLLAQEPPTVGHCCQCIVIYRLEDSIWFPLFINSFVYEDCFPLKFLKRVPLYVVTVKGCAPDWDGLQQCERLRLVNKWGSKRVLQARCMGGAFC